MDNDESRQQRFGVGTINERELLEKRNERTYWLPTIRVNVTNQQIYDVDFSRPVPVTL